MGLGENASLRGYKREIIAQSPANFILGEKNEEPLYGAEVHIEKR